MLKNVTFEERRGTTLIGWVVVNDGFDFGCPFGGYKKSGNGREWGEFGFHDYLEVKDIPGYGPA